MKQNKKIKDTKIKMGQPYGGEGTIDTRTKTLKLTRQQLRLSSRHMIGGRKLMTYK